MAPRERTAEQVTSIVDRIGAGDAFAAGVLHGLFTHIVRRRAPPQHTQ